MADGPNLTLEEYVALYEERNGKATRGEIAKHLDISDAFLSQILSGIRSPSYRAMRKIELRTGGVVSVDTWARRNLGSR
jgi:transcriptional regulator with XRE-family HTH domain